MSNAKFVSSHIMSDAELFSKYDRFMRLVDNYREEMRLVGKLEQGKLHAYTVNHNRFAQLFPEFRQRLMRNIKKARNES